MFYDEFVKQCNAKKVSRQKACIDCGVSRTAWNKWRDGAIPNGETLQKLSDYFGVTTDRLLYGEIMDPVPQEQSTRGMSPQEREAFYKGLHVGQRKEKPADQMADGFSKYDLLNDENRAAIDALIDRLLASQSDE